MTHLTRSLKVGYRGYFNGRRTDIMCFKLQERVGRRHYEMNKKEKKILFSELENKPMIVSS